MNHRISIVIATRKFNLNLYKTINSINKQIYLPTEIIIVSNKKIFQEIYVNKKIHLKMFQTNVKNQVHQRNIAIKNMSTSCTVILQLDDRVILDKKCLYELNNSWKKSNSMTIGIGLNQINILTNSGLINSARKSFNMEGQVLTNGINVDYCNIKKDKEVMWLKGGLSSWLVKKNQRIKERVYPIRDWSVFEDVEFCLNKKKNEKLIVAHKAKVKIIEINKIDLQNLLYRGTMHTYLQRKLVKKYFKRLTYFYFTIPTLVFLSLIISFLTLNISKFIYNIGRFRGFFIINFY